MPTAYVSEDNDSVVASYDVYITSPPSKAELPSATSSSSSRLFVLQYPSHRPNSKPYNAARGQKPVELRLKPKTGMVEVEVPILTREHFNRDAGQKYGQALAESQLFQPGNSYGLAGGFASGPTSVQNVNLNNVPAHDNHEPFLDTQTLMGKIAVPCERDPIYMLGSFRDDGLHLTHLDAVIQMRPQLHHIDAEEEANHKKFQSGVGPSGRMKPGFEAAATKLESKAIELRMKDSKEDPKDRNLNANARMLRDIQADQWESHDWVDEDEEESMNKAEAYTTLKAVHEQTNFLKHLKSMITDDEWLEKMSVPREDGKKGLRAKLKGRDRERARRKKVDHQRKQKNSDGVRAATRNVASSESDLSSLSDQSDVEVVDANTDRGEVVIKDEPDKVAPSSVTQPSVTTAAPVSNTVKKRGRPKKT